MPCCSVHKYVLILFDLANDEESLKSRKKGLWDGGCLLE